MRRIGGDVTQHVLVPQLDPDLLGDIGQLVHGEARFELDAAAAVFVAPDSDGVLSVTAMAQGHYPLSRPDSEEPRLLASPDLPSLVRVDGSAVQRLVQRTVVEAERLVEGAMRAP